MFRAQQPMISRNIGFQMQQQRNLVPLSIFHRRGLLRVKGGNEGGIYGTTALFWTLVGMPLTIVFFFWEVMPYYIFCKPKGGTLFEL